MKILSSLRPYGFVNGTYSFNLKKALKNISPEFLVNHIVKKNSAKKYTVDYLKNNYVSDLTENEKWTLLSVLLYLERKLEKPNYLEIGVYAGGTIKFLKENSKKSFFTGVDLFEDFKPSDDNTHMWKNYTMEQVGDALGKDRVVLFKGNSVEVLKKLHDTKNKYDFIFIDGNHTYQATKNDLDASLPLLNDGAYIAFHNASSGITQEDKYYIKLDGGPWAITIDFLSNEHFMLIESSDRVKVFKYIKKAID